MAVKVAEGEIVIKTQGASRGTNRLTNDLNSLSKQSRETGRQLSHSEKELQRFGMGMVSATSNAAGLSAALRFAGKTGGVALGLAVLARGTIGFVQQMQDLRIESEKTSMTLAETFRSGMLSKSSQDITNTIEGMGRQIKDLELETTKLDVWKDIRKLIEAASAKLGVNLDLQTKTTEKAIEEAKAYKVKLEAEKNRLKTIERIVRFADHSAKIAEDELALSESAIKLDAERSKYTTEENDQKKKGLLITQRLGKEDKSKTMVLKQSESLSIAQKQYEYQNSILSDREQEFKLLSLMADKLKDAEKIDAARNDLMKARVNAQQAELGLIKQMRTEQAKQLGGSQAGQQALQGATARKAIVDKKAGFKTEENAVLARQQSENAQRRARGESTPLSMQNIRDRMAEEAVGLRTPPVPSNALQTIGKGVNGLRGGLGNGMRAEIKPVSDATTLPTSAQPAVPAEATSKPTASLDTLIKAFNDLASVLKQAPLVTSAA
jgi:hypothetical protein